MKRCEIDYMEDVITLNEIIEWSEYFNDTGVILDFVKIKELYKGIQKSNKSIRKSDLPQKDKDYLMHLNRYRKTVLENIIVNSSPFKNGNYLEGVGFINNYDERILKVNPNYDISPTYRLTSKSPCLSNMDSVLKEIVIPEEGYKLLSIDFKHQEPWIIVNLLEDKELLDILKGNEDFYRGLLDRFNIEINKSNRDIMKQVWNASIYGSGRSTIGFNDVEWITDVYNFINENGRVKSLRKKVETNLKKDKAIYTRFLLNRSIPYDGKKSVRQAFNSIFQMSGAGVMYAGLKSIQLAVYNRPPNLIKGTISIYLTLHDEYLLQIPYNTTEEEISEFINSIDFNIEGWTPARIEVKEGMNWRECK